ncbi:MAG: transglycosylase domain-containing protein, partial [Nitrospinaceae bacterium]
MIRNLAETIVFGIFALLLVGVLTGVGVYFALKADLPQLPESLDQIALSLPTEVYSAEGDVLKILGERHPVALDEISPYFTKAIIAVEDARFYKHHGVDHIGLVRALIKNIKVKRIIQGGSTITQQLSKNLFFSFERNWIRKLKELLVAVQLEATFSKEEILEAYCNQVYFGSGAYGVEEASKIYFGKRAKDLTRLQAALLAGLPNSP